MSKKTTTTSSGTNQNTFNFDPQSLEAYHKNLGPTMDTLRGFATNPYGNPQFQLDQSVRMENASKLGLRGMSNVFNNARALGYGNNSGLMSSMINRAGRDTSSLQAQGFRDAAMNAGNRQMTSLGMLNAFQPLMTGSTGSYTGNQTQQESGTGTWLPQLISAGIGAGTAFATGGMSGAAKGAGAVGKAGSGVMGAIPGFGGGGVPNSLFAGIGAGGPPGFGGGGYGYGSQGSPFPPSMFGGQQPF